MIHSQTGRRDIIRILIITGCLLLVPFCLWHVPWVQTGLSHAASWRGKPFAEMWFLLIAVVYSILGLPRQPLCVAAGLTFGVWVGGMIAVLAYQVGASVLYAGGWASMQLSVRRGKACDRLLPRSVQLFIHHLPFRAVLMLRLMPIGSAFLLSVGAGILRVNFAAFSLATLVGGLPQTLIFLLAGSSGQKDHQSALILAVALFLFSSFLGLYLLQHYRLMRQKYEAAEKAKSG